MNGMFSHRRDTHSLSTCDALDSDAVQKKERDMMSVYVYVRKRVSAPPSNV